MLDLLRYLLRWRHAPARSTSHPITPGHRLIAIILLRFRSSEKEKERESSRQNSPMKQYPDLWRKQQRYPAVVCFGVNGCSRLRYILSLSVTNITNGRDKRGGVLQIVSHLSKYIKQHVGAVSGCQAEFRRFFRKTCAVIVYFECIASNRNRERVHSVHVTDYTRAR